MSAELTELLENVSEPAMFIDAETVLVRGRRRRLRRRLYGTAAVLGAAALIVPVAAALGADSAPSPVPAASPPVDCAFPDPGPGSGWDSAAGLPVGGTPWLDSGPPAGARTMRVQVNTDTCHGLAVAVSHPSSYSGTTADVSGRPRDAFWVVDVVGGGVDRFGKAVPVVSTAVALLPDGQRVCGVGTTPAAGQPEGIRPSLSTSGSAPAGHGWQATFAKLTGAGNPQISAVLQICEGTRLIQSDLRPLNSITEPAAPFR